MLSKNQIKLIKSLGQKKNRQQLGLFTVEGIKGINEFLDSDFELESLFTTELIFDTSANKTNEISEIELKKVSSLKNPNTALAIFKIPKPVQPSNDGLIVVLDDVRDPGNLGTIIRLCDWYGVEDLVCSKATVDCYNSKVVQATMGSLTRVNVVYLDLEDYLKSQKNSFGTFMSGENIYTTNLPETGVVILGNEANGISENIKSMVERKITIPQFGKNQTTESLNVANATAIILSEFKRRTIEK
ncbi:RNA methyltransferase [Winogradskyella sp. SYSU M77433]|uniref:TrmH family RNA methyltransferase n=1 Tax=Winogradskyella sp. SYSU M77433 TaxID=3042722 RepID=UPI002480D330|nr:RNA methyltransferase [Winogradskyella sp. SYSU M77433]MDH7911485.1 RNA methyltransferase [Winogradskyella sp. SYSU M77433]